MKVRLSIIILVLLLFCGCNVSHLKSDNAQSFVQSNTFSTPESGVEKVPYAVTESSSFNNLGKFVCSNEYFSNKEYFKRFPNDIPSITFYANGRCELLVNYLEGICTVCGNYTVDGGKILVKLIDLEDTVLVDENAAPYISDEYVFNIIDNDHLVVDRGFYAVNAGDVFSKL